ncbi:MAG: 4'-phosphopantetheinyl transferase superfamily protein [Alcanivoracaceae bacterium]|nr:4'-phosphopantetheinyl transferase superfamily protein [Alcanivoracaceae bacterium]
MTRAVRMLQRAHGSLATPMHTDGNYISLWQLDCRSDVAMQWLAQAATLLPGHELDTAQTRHRAQDRRRFLLSRILLRRALTALQPRLTESSWQFSLGSHGKLQLVDDFPSAAFNLSHSGNLIMVALAQHGHVGIDIELPETRIQHRRVAERYFHKSECAALARCDGDMWTRQFYRLWMLKEASIKSLGLRVADGLKHTEFGLDGRHITLKHNFDASLQPSLIEVAGYELALCLADAPASMSARLIARGWNDNGQPCSLPCSVLLTPRAPA